MDISKAISQKRYKIGCKLVLITNRKSYISFRLVPKSVNLNDLERRNGPYFSVISPNSVVSGAHSVKVVEDITKLEMWANAQRDGRPAEYSWRPLFNAAKFG